MHKCRRNCDTRSIFAKVLEQCEDDGDHESPHSQMGEKKLQPQYGCRIDQPAKDGLRGIRISYCLAGSGLYHTTEYGDTGIGGGCDIDDNLMFTK